MAVDGELQERIVEIAAFEGETAIITAGLQTGDEVLTTRITEVSAGLRVRKEGEATPPRGEGRPNAPNVEGKPVAEGAAPQGRPSREEMTAILKANDMTREAFSAMPQAERRTLIAQHRASAKAEN